jgi:hypothetical protein
MRQEVMKWGALWEGKEFVCMLPNAVLFQYDIFIVAPERL